MPLQQGAGKLHLIRGWNKGKAKLEKLYLIAGRETGGVPLKTTCILGYGEADPGRHKNSQMGIFHMGVRCDLLA